MNRPLELLNALAEEYEYVCYVNTTENTVETLYQTEQVARMFGTIDATLPSNRRFDVFLKRFIVPEDLETFLAIVIKREEIIARLMTEKYYDIKVHGNEDGVISTYAVRFVLDKNTKRDVLIGIKNIEEETVLRGINGTMMDNFLAIYVVNLEDGSFSIVKSHGLNEIATKSRNSWIEACDSFSRIVSPDDQNKIYSLGDVNIVKTHLQGAESREYTYRLANNGTWHRATASVLERRDGVAIKASVSIAKLDNYEAERETLNRRIATQNKKMRQNLDIIGILASEYSSVYYVSFADNVVIPYPMNENFDGWFRQNFEEGAKYQDVVKDYIDRFVYFRDVEMVRNACTIQNIKRQLHSKKKFTVTYRTTRYGEPTFCELTFVKPDDTEVPPTAFALGYAHKDEEIVRRYASQELETEYISLFYVDLEHDHYRTVIQPNTTKAMDRKDRFWSKAMADFASECEPMYRELVTQIGSPKFLRDELAYVDRREYLYRFPDNKYPWRRAIIKVVERIEGVAKVVIASFMSIDAERSRALDLEKTVENQNSQLEMQQRQLEIALNMAKSANDAKTDFLFSMSHDIRTPLNAITGYASLASKYIDEPERIRGYVEKIRIAGDHLCELVNQVLDMTQIEAGKLTFRDDPFDLLRCAKEMLEIIDQSAKNQGVSIHFEEKNVKNSYVYGDAGRINQILLNILGNAVKYTPEGGHIEFSFAQRECLNPGFASFAFEVKDDGIGMSPEYIRRIYEPFSRENTSTVSRVEGAGLGMSIVKRILDLMGGNIRISSEPLIGTSVLVTFMLRQQDENEIRKAKKEVSTSVLSGKRILLVEDNEMNREICENMLESQNIIVEEAEDGDVAVDKVRAALESGDVHHYDAILMDIQMPRMNGYEATTMIRQVSKSFDVYIPIIALTANAFESDRHNALKFGMDEHIAKPLRPAMLWETLVKFF